MTEKFSVLSYNRGAFYFYVTSPFYIDTIPSQYKKEINLPIIYVQNLYNKNSYHPNMDSSYFLIAQC